MKNKIISFIWQHILLFVSLYVMTLGGVGTLFAMVYVGVVVMVL